MKRALALIALLVGIGGLVYGGRQLLKEDFEPNGTKATAARSAAVTTVADKLEVITTGSTVWGHGVADACHEGQNNWKVHEPFAWDCRVGASALIDGSRTLDGVVDSLTATHERLISVGCQPRSARGGLVVLAASYWEKYRARPGYGIDDLPSEYYDCADGNEIEVVPTSPSADRLNVDATAVFGGGFSSDQVLSSTPVDGASIAAAARADVAGLYVIRVGRPYYRIDH